jgi:hypothetical protein
MTATPRSEAQTQQDVIDELGWDTRVSPAEVGVQVGSQVDLKQDGIEFPGAVIFGVTSNMSEIEDKVIADGRFITPEEVQLSSLVCVLGGEIKDKFFPNSNAIGQTLKIRGLPMRVVGIEEKRGAFFGDSLDRHVYIPATTHMQIFGRNGLSIHGKALDRENFRPVIEDARVELDEVLHQVEETTVLAAEQVLRRPIPGRWSTLEVVCHIADMESVYAERVKRALVEDRPTLPNADENGYAAALAYPQRDLEEELAVIEYTRRQLGRILQGLAPDAMQRVGVHSTDGPMTVEQLVARITRHIPHHAEFIREKRRLMGA